jgi:hypothetical protein
MPCDINDSSRLLLFSVVGWVVVVALACCFGRRALHDDRMLLAILVLANFAVSCTVAYMQLPFLRKCALRVDSRSGAEWIERTRGPNYLLFNKQSPEEVDNARGCVLSGWGVGHVVMYGLIAALVPRLWKELFVIGLLWEALEYPFGVAYAADPVLNGIGIAVGLAVGAGVRSALVRTARA